MSAEFYAEKYSIPLDVAGRISSFISEMRSYDIVDSMSPWAKHGLVRVYIETKSQNNRHFFLPAYKFYYNAVQNDLFIETSYNTFGTIPLSRIEGFGNSYFSGAKTRKQLFKFKEDFYAKKIHWD